MESSGGLRSSDSSSPPAPTASLLEMIDDVALLSHAETKSGRVSFGGIVTAKPHSSKAPPADVAVACVRALHFSQRQLHNATIVGAPLASLQRAMANAEDGSALQLHLFELHDKNLVLRGQLTDDQQVFLKQALEAYRAAARVHVVAEQKDAAPAQMDCAADSESSDDSESDSDSSSNSSGGPGSSSRATKRGRSALSARDVNASAGPSKLPRRDKHDTSSERDKLRRAVAMLREMENERHAQALVDLEQEEHERRLKEIDDLENS